MDKRDYVAVFRDRLQSVIERSGESHTSFARRAGMDRSTLSQLLSPANDRLPRLETLAGIAASHQVSLDWLVGLSQRDQLGADIVAETMQIERDAISPTDERLLRWHAEAAAYKIRHVPMSLPDLLKTEAVLRHEYAEFAVDGPARSIEIAQARLAHQRRPETDMEICTPIQTLESFAMGAGVWGSLPAAEREAQLDHMIRLADELYPTFRWFLYDGRQRYSAPITIFGPQRAAIYVGHMYFVFHSTEHIRVLTAHFDRLIRAAVVQPNEIGGALKSMKRRVES